MFEPTALSQRARTRAAHVQPHPAVVGIGASSGGLKALQQFVQAIPPDSGMAYVVILHLDPDRESRMAALLQDRTSIPVTQVSGPTPVEPNHIYVCPPDRDLEMKGWTIDVRPRSERSERVPVDFFFGTLSEVAGADAVGVVLSGTGSDGAAGVRWIREAGGISVAQAPGEAEYEGMPASAIATGWVDLVLPAAQIPMELIRLRARRRDLEAKNPTEREIEAQLAPIFAALRTTTGHDFSRYKRPTVLRRLDRRLLFNSVSTLTEYLPVLRASEAESQALLKDLLISVSAFFRDPGEFEALAQALPGLFEGRAAGDSIRVWVVGCATGEEVYSLAMLLAEHTSTLADPPVLQLFATDIDQQGYSSGREGLYPSAAVAHLSPERLQRFFIKEPGGYRIAKSLRDRVLFALHDVLRDPPFARMDLISCRNFFIYLQPDAQQQVLETFHYALNPGGILFMGASESAGEEGLFAPVGGGAHKIFRRGATSARVLPRVSSTRPTPWSRVTARDGQTQTPGGEDDAFSYGSLHLHLLEEYAPPSLIVDERWELVHLSEAAGRYVSLGAGEPSRRLLDLTKGELRTALRTGVYQAFELGQETTRTVRLEGDGSDRQVKVRVKPAVGEYAARRRFALVVFEEVAAPAAQLEPSTAAPFSRSERQNALDMEEQLRRTRDQLDSASAAHDRSVAELQTVNEELLSINEEQRAAMEELETGREEIQAINEELTTINQEHQSTIEELKRTNADLENLIESTEIGTIFVDADMRIRRYTPTVARLFNFASSDVGRPLGDITHRLHYATLDADARYVLSSLKRTEREVESEGGEWFIVRINPYRSHEGQADGAVLTFFDHTSQHRLGAELKEAKAQAEAANAAKGIFLSTLSHELRTPLSAMMGYAEILTLDGAINAKQQKKVDRIVAGGRHLDAMIEQLLDMSRLDRGNIGIACQAVDARTIAKDAHGLMSALAEEKGLAFDLALPDEPLTMTTDPGKACQVLLNLLGNAVKYTQVGEIRLRVGEQGGRVFFDVSDTGPGIAEEHHEKVFDRFWQVESGLTRKAGGLGIGLAAAREYSRLLGGDVELQSAPGKGSTFRLWLPKSLAEDGAVAAPTTGWEASDGKTLTPPSPARLQ